MSLCVHYRNLERVVYTLSIVQLACNVATLILFSPEGDGDVLAVALLCGLILFSFFTAVTMHRMLSFARSSGSDNSLSRVGGQYYVLLAQIPMWMVYILLWFSVTSSPSVLSISRTSCATARFLKHIECIPLGIEIVLAGIIPIASYFAARALRRRAVELHGTEMVAESVFGRKYIPAWMAPHVADLGGDVRLPSGVN
ncbi:hypothetical protein B0H14DRAFT_2713723 [Mycena olivaceomarginata]|nr:hypothetical protein B0H14DRAFT_2847960 [Mycena olivaceomarginata]KAJ7876708.1 hypothetical protein B0H14DRAFT_2713723 [Mycena olivaceomarginata]